MTSLLLIPLMAVGCLPFVKRLFDLYHETRQQRIVIVADPHHKATFKPSQLKEAKRFAKLHPYGTFMIVDGREVVVRGAAKMLQQIELN